MAYEPQILRQMKEEVEKKRPGQREPIASRLIAISCRESLALPLALVEVVGQVTDLYRRHRNNPEWDRKPEQSLAAESR